MDESKIRYLEMVQGIINRMASNSFLLKGWTITLVAGLFTFTVGNAHAVNFIISYLPTVTFWLLDSFYLQQERKYRYLFEKSAKGSHDDINFRITPAKSDFKLKTCYVQSMFSRTELWFYLPTIVVISLIIVFA